MQTTVTIKSNVHLQGGYYILTVELPDEFPESRAGQFLHVQVPGLDGRILRRPFSIFDRNPGEIRVLYKIVGNGTDRLAQLPAGTKLDVLGPLGNGFSPLPDGGVLVAGGYGCAPMFQLAKNCKPAACLIGGRTASDILLRDEYAAVNCPVLVSTDDGSEGFKGRVTGLLEEFKGSHDVNWIAACGPIPMLRALAELMGKLGIQGEISLDSSMCCGAGACFACVTKIRDEHSPDGWSYRRICHDGPIFKAETIVW